MSMVWRIVPVGIFALLSLCTMDSVVAATPDTAAAIVTAADDGVRVVGAADAARVRLQIFSLRGSLIYDSGWRQETSSIGFPTMRSVTA